ncbi:disease resistance protein RPP13 [Brachypodium distachyon]|nr:disease resistance protein RPP13 [Brachypodium distachyon]XP_014756248.1 disease resistance protein RPP13 [Brachypodium distachyon]XP_014756249.1 disease resistance protein RPP13 [Brachypodium distachyon]XP_014756250.1 disease resistance protein RPP13 [Brachypodium distachyon]XP_024316630.1 disease resistance protein RPP13 [Brachypodium distachyon]XP_024316631.1 disease resistance protein RPP13 [Brachypodium distachyon]|eukprot:XP_010233813.1 disease resistance protein RPP13 [Brachypodium distachyon]
MAEIVSATSGVMNPLLGKLTVLLGEEYKKLTGVRKQASFLKDELNAMKALLDKLELMDEPDPLAKDWRDHVREMSYDMENCIDDFMHDLGGGGAADAKAGFVKKMAKRLRRLVKRHKIADRIEELKVLAHEANERRLRYKIDDCINSASGVVPVDPRVSAIYKEAAGLVGIDGPRKDIVDWLTASVRKLNVVSIVGFGGLGKTTLAKQVYDEIRGKFECMAFVSVSQRPDMTSLLSGLQLKLGVYQSRRAHEVTDIIDRLREHLKNKRYLIVVDDLWDQSAWDTIRCVFPEGDNGGTVIVTTRLDDVACGACHDHHGYIYRMKPLANEDSKRLFFSRVFRSEDGCPPQFEEVSAQILKKCGGLPLAIITIASLLASRQARSRRDWESIKDSLGTNFAAYPTLEGMKNILNLSYINLPLRLRACFLYLGMYPEDREIMRDDLTGQWVAEGFVSGPDGADLEEVAKSYFNELINRSMIQPGEQTMYGEVCSCRVHDLMLDLILSKCTENNFLSAARSYEEMERMHGRNYKVRRLSLSLSSGASTEPGSTIPATSLSQVRSFAWFGYSKYTPPLCLFKYLRVLVFEFLGYLDMTIDLSAIGHLFLLRYLKVSQEISGSIDLPVEVKGLVHLETLEISRTSARSFPSDVVCLPNLFRLNLPYNTGLPQGIRNMKSIRTLHCFGMEKSSVEDIKGLGELTSLRELELSTWDGDCLTEDGVDALVSSVGKLRGLKRLDLSCQREGYDDQLESLPDHPLPRIEVLNLRFWQFLRVPQWIGGLRCLQVLYLWIAQFSSEDVRVPGMLPSLVDASFKVVDIPQDKVVVGTGLFPALERVEFRSFEDVTAYLGFEAGAMPKLQKLSLWFGPHKWGGATPVGMHNLQALQQIDVRLWPMGILTREQREQVLKDVESAFGDVSRAHPARPTVSVRER